MTDIVVEAAANLINLTDRMARSQADVTLSELREMFATFGRLAGADRAGWLTGDFDLLLGRARRAYAAQELLIKSCIVADHGGEVFLRPEMEAVYFATIELQERLRLIAGVLGVFELWLESDFAARTDVVTEILTWLETVIANSPAAVDEKHKQIVESLAGENARATLALLEKELTRLGSSSTVFFSVEGRHQWHSLAALIDKAGNAYSFYAMLLRARTSTSAEEVSATIEVARVRQILDTLQGLPGLLDYANFFEENEIRSSGQIRASLRDLFSRISKLIEVSREFTPPAKPPEMTGQQFN